MSTPTTSTSLLRKLVSFDTTSRNSNLALIEWAADYLQSHGARVELVHNAGKDKANLLGTLGPDREGGIVLSGHTDVVPVDGQDWTSDPFALAERDGRLYGRGSSDMKGFIAACLAAAGDWRGRKLLRPLHFAFSYDEEVGCLGVHDLVRRIGDRLPAPAFAIVGEPTDMQLGVAHNGVVGAQTSFRGVAGHASEPGRGVNAIAAAAEFVRFLGDVARLPHIAGHGCTLNVGRICGGTATNIIAERCSVSWEYRAATQQDLTAIREAVDGFLAGNAFTALEVTNRIELDVPHFASRMSPELLELMVRFGGQLPTTTIPFGTEAGIFEHGSIPAIVCGPGSIRQAHRPDEWIACEALSLADRFMTQVGAWASQADPG
ncbi:MAG: acetylornithine deacetylase [Proteobacteria bacterium]|nr:acetylornithine deacetylase [Pseudomonadota bacterium]